MCRRTCEREREREREKGRETQSVCVCVCVCVCVFTPYLISNGCFAAKNGLSNVFINPDYAGNFLLP